jgi:hypothetical protein
LYWYNRTHTDAERLLLVHEHTRASAGEGAAAAAAAALQTTSESTSQHALVDERACAESSGTEASVSEVLVE